MALPAGEKLKSVGPGRLGARLERQATATRMGALTDWGAKVIVETFSERTARYEGRLVSDIAAEEGKAPFDALLIVVADDLRTSFRNAVDDDTDADWQARAQLWRIRRS